MSQGQRWTSIGFSKNASAERCSKLLLQNACQQWQWSLSPSNPIHWFHFGVYTNGCGSKNRYQNGTLVSGNMDQNPRNPSCLFLSHSQMTSSGWFKQECGLSGSRLRPGDSACHVFGGAVICQQHDAQSQRFRQQAPQKMPLKSLQTKAASRSIINYRATEASCLACLACLATRMTAHKGHCHRRIWITSLPFG